MSSAGEALPAAPPRERTVLPLLVLIPVLVAVVFGGYVVDGALSSREGGVVVVGSFVRLRPAPGWVVDPSVGDASGVRLTRGNGHLDVLAGPFDGSAEALLRTYVRGSLEPQAEQLSVSDPERVALASGAVGLRVAYVGMFQDVAVPIEGELTATVTEAGTGVMFDGWAPSGQLRAVRDDVVSMIDAAEVA
jgi:hypothetical protein